MAVADETAGMIKGLAEVVQNQQILQNTAMKETTAQLKQLSETVATLTQSLPPAGPTGTSLRLPNLVLPKYTGKEHLDRFLEQLQTIFQSSDVPAKFWLTYLKQQTQQDSRAYDAICTAEKEHAAKILGPDPSKTSPAKFAKLYKQCVDALKLKRGKPRDQQLRELLGTYYTMSQARDESVADFAHRFRETQNELEKLLPNIHRTPDSKGNTDIELIYSFVIKLQEPIAKALISREFAYSSLQAIIEAAERFELHALPRSRDRTVIHEHAEWKPAEIDAVYSGTSANGPKPYSAKKNSHMPSQNTRNFRDSRGPSQGKLGSDSQPNRSSSRPSPRPSFSDDTHVHFGAQASPPPTEICRNFNKFRRSFCELDHNRCAHDRLHKCEVCHQWGCKACNHRASSSSNATRVRSKSNSQGQAHVASNIAASSDQSVSSASEPCFPPSDQAPPTPDLTTVLSNMHSSLQSLSVRMEKLERPPLPTPLVAPPAASNPGSAPGPDFLVQAPAYSYPAITAIPNHVSIPALDLANKHILWTPITSAGVSLPLPIDSCCSLSLVSKAHADVIAQKHPHLTFTKLQSSLPVAVANPSSQLAAIGFMQVPIIWENGRPSIFSMLVVPGLAWPILFGQNHLRITKAHTDHAGLKVHFADPPMNFTVTCRDTNPLDAFPPMRNQPSSSSSMAPPSTNVTCLLTAMPSPSHPSTHIRLHRGFNLVTLCLVMTASLVGSSLFSSPQWLEGQEISPGIQVISGPFDLHALSSVPSLDDPLFFKTEGHHYPKCRPSRMVPPFDPPPVQAGVLNSPIQPLDIGNAFANDVPAFSTKFYMTVVVKSTKDHTVLPHNANLGSIQPFNSNHEQVFSEAADHTAHTLADTWFEYAKHTGTTQNPSSVARSQAQPTGTSCFPQSWSLQAQTSEMTKAGLDSSYLSPFLPEPDLDPPHVHPPVEDVSLDPHSEEYFQQLVAALDLETDTYAHVDLAIMSKFKALIRKYSHAFYLPGSELTPITGFHHNIDIGDSLPASPSGNKWILTVVCPYSNYLRAIPVPDKTATTAANVLFHEVFLQLGFPSVLQSDRGGEFLNALLHRITQLLSIKQVFTSGFHPRLNGATERSHRFLNSALGIFCEHQQEKWEQFLQPAVYSHNVSPISGTTNITPFFLVFGRDAPSPETISFDLPVNPLPPDHYARHLLSHMKVAHQQFSQVKSDLRHHQKEVYYRKARFLAIPPGKIVYVRKEPQTHKPGMATRFLRSFDGPFQVIGHPYDRNDLLTLKNLSTGAVIPRPVNIEKCVVIPEQETFDLQPSNDSVVESEPKAESPAPLPTASHVNPELCQVAYEFGKYLASLPNKTATASQVCKQVYLSYPSAREILTRHGKL